MTTTTTPMWEVLEASLRARHAVHLAYHGRERLVCPHALGWHNARALVLAYQSAAHTSVGCAEPDPRRRWRCLFVDEIEWAMPDIESPWESADNYVASHPFHAVDQATIAA